MLRLKSRYTMFPRERINDPHSRESSHPGVRMKGLVRAKEAIVRQIGTSRSTMRDSHAKVSETCPFSSGFLGISRTNAAHDYRVSLFLRLLLQSYGKQAWGMRDGRIFFEIPQRTRIIKLDYILFLEQSFYN